MSLPAMPTVDPLVVIEGTSLPPPTSTTTAAATDVVPDDPSPATAPTVPMAPMTATTNTVTTATDADPDSIPPAIAPTTTTTESKTTILATNTASDGIPPSINDPDSADFDPMSFTLSPTGQLMESKEEWERRPRMTLTASGEMVFRPLRMQCTHCEEAYTKTTDLYAHIRTHQRHTECPHCSKSLNCMATFVYHVRTHTMEKPYYCPCDGCDFQNAVKYNLKVHLASIRHGGKANLKKYAKVLDLDVSTKSMRKRKDNSVHELGSRRSKKRRKLNNASSSSSRAEVHHHHHYGQQLAMGPHGAPYGGYYGPEEYDQFAAQLLLLSAYNGYDAGAVAMDWAHNLGALGQHQMMPPAVDPKSELLPMTQPNDLMALPPPQPLQLLKPEAMHDPNFANYYAMPAMDHLTVNVGDPQGTAAAAGHLTSKDSKVSAGTLSNCTPKEQAADAVDGGEEQKRNEEAVAADGAAADGEGADKGDGGKLVEQEDRGQFVPKQEPDAADASAAAIGQQPMYSEFGQMASQNAEAMMAAQDPVLMMQCLPQFDANAMAASQYMMAPAYYPPANGYYGQFMFDPAMAPPPYDTESDKKIEGPPLPNDMKFLDAPQPPSAE